MSHENEASSFVVGAYSSFACYHSYSVQVLLLMSREYVIDNLACANSNIFCVRKYGIRYSTSQPYFVVSTNRLITFHDYCL